MKVVAPVAGGLIAVCVGSFVWVSAEENGVKIAETLKCKRTSQPPEMIPNTIDRVVHR